MNLSGLRRRIRYGGADGPFSSLGPNTGVITAVPGGVTIPANGNRMGIQLTSDAGGTGVVYGLCGSGTPSATNFHFSFGPGGSWDGQVSQSVFTGAIQLYCSGSIKVGVVEA